MKKTIIILITFLIVLLCSSFTIDENIVNGNNKDFDIDGIPSYEKTYITEDYDLCGDGSVKTYMDYRFITSVSSKQYQYIYNHMTVDPESGFLYDEDGFIGAALGRYFGDIGSKYYFTLENGVILPIVKIESKADIDTDDSNCFNPNDTSVIEFVIDVDKAKEYFGSLGTNLVLSGNYGNFSTYKGSIVKVEKVTDEKLNAKETKYSLSSNKTEDLNIFYYGSGY